VYVVGYGFNETAMRDEALLWATSCSVCRADFDCSGTLAVADIFSFLNAWFAGESGADFNNSGGLTVTDVFAFLDAWFGGCQ
jgi:hypothetical protein